MNPILKAIMFTGFGFMIVTPAKFFFCVAAVPFDPTSCVAVSLNMLNAFSMAGFTTTLIESGVSGAVVYVLSGAWKWS